jgi:hypothetical protein
LGREEVESIFAAAFNCEESRAFIREGGGCRTWAARLVLHVTLSVALNDVVVSEHDYAISVGETYLWRKGEEAVAIVLIPNDELEVLKGVFLRKGVRGFRPGC